MRKQIGFAAMALVLGVSLAACGKKTDTGAGATSPAPAAGTASPAPAAGGTNPAPAGGAISPSPAAGAGGTVDAQAIFKANCVACHGDNLEGKLGPNTNLQKVGAQKSRDQIVTQIKNGGGGMPPFQGKLKDNEINALADWLSAKK